LLFARDAFQTMGVHRVAKQRKLRIKKIVVDDPSLSIQEFCDAEGLGRATYYNLKKEGRAPRECESPDSFASRMPIASRGASAWSRSRSRLDDLGPNVWTDV
jgi:predicted DNA-binding transcriptional regulator AlpA